MAINATAFTKTPQAKDDAYNWTEDALLGSGPLSGDVVTLAVMVNDLGGNAKTLYSVDDGNGNTLVPDFDLLTADATNGSELAWEPTAAGNKIRINNGQIEFKLDGSLSSLGASGVNALAAGDVVHDEFVYAIRMANGTLSQARVTFSLTGANDAPVIAQGPQSGTVEEDQTLLASGQFTATDPDHNATRTWSVVSANGTNGSNTGAYGSLAVDNTGQWTYTLTNASAAVQALAAGESHDESFTIRVTDDQGAYAEQTVKVTVSGTNDVPIVTSTPADAAGAVQEDTTLITAGQLAASDVDHGATQTWSVQGSDDGAYGSIGVDGTGKWTYTLANGADVVQSLAEGEAHQENFTVRVTDDQGASADQTVKVTVSGTNDAPVMALADTSGTVTAVPAASSGGGAPTPIVFTVQQYLGVQSNNLTTLRNYAAAHQADYTVQTNVIDYTDDPGGFAGELPGSSPWPAAEAQNVSGTGGINNSFFARITANFSVPAADTYTFRTYNDDGVFLMIDNQLIINDSGIHPELPFNGSIALSPGNHSLELFFFEFGGEASLELSARNSTGIFGLLGDSGGGLGGAVQVTDSGAIGFSDVDLTDAHVVSAAPVGTTVGTLTAVKASDTTGTGTGGQVDWTYTADNTKLESLAQGETKFDRFDVTVDDHHGGVATRQVEVSIVGVNDAPVLAAADVTGAVIEPVTPVGNLTDSGIIAFSDVDLTDVHHVTVGAIGTSYGSLTASIAADTTGSGTGGQLAWTYSIPASVVDILAQGEVKTESFNVTVDDGNGGVATRRVDVTITGTNDTPVVGAQLSVSGNEGSGVIPQYLLAGATDADQGSVLHATNLVWAEGGSGLPAGFSRSADSLYVDTSNPAYDSLAQGSSFVAHLGYDVVDQFGASVHQTAVVTINGVNDAPVAVDDTASLTVTSLASQVNTNVVNWVDWTSVSGGSVSGTIDLGNGQTIGVTYTGENAFVQTSGGTNYYTTPPTQPGDTTLGTGTYTSAAVANGPTGSDIIALQSATQKTLTFTQPVDNLFFAVVSLNGNGYLFDQNFDIMSYGRGYWGDGYATKIALPDGRYEVVGTGELHGVLRVDGSVQSLTWTSESNEYWNGFTVGTYGKAQTSIVSGNLLANDTDVDQDPLSVGAVNGQQIVGNSVTLTLPSGARVQVNRDGSYLYDENAAFVSLGGGQTKPDSFQYTVSDSHGGTDTGTATINVSGINDAPVANNDIATTNEDAPISIAVLGNDTDVDAGDSKFLTSATGAQHGSLSLNGGNVVYTPAANYNGGDSFSYTMRDAAGAASTATVNVTVIPVSDTYAPANLIVNGSFEQQIGTGYLSGGSTAMPGWTVIGSDVDRVAASGWQPGDGAYSLDLNGFHPGGVQQVLQTTPGAQYTVGFALSKNPGNTDHATVQVSAAGSSQPYTFSAANSSTDMKWSQQALTFTAAGTTTTLSFASTYPTDSTGGFPINAQGPALDEVVAVTNKVINNFTKGTGGDVLQLGGLLTSIGAPHDGTAFSGNFLRFAQSGSDTLVQIDANGGGDAYMTVATLIGQSLTQADTPNYLL